MRTRAITLVIIASGTLLLGSSCGKTYGTDASTKKIKFADTSEYRSSYLISAETLSAEAEAALVGFALSRQAETDGSVVYHLAPKKTGYHDQSYRVKSGQSLYFIETSQADDSPGQGENPSDDMAVIVDADGYIVP